MADSPRTHVWLALARELVARPDIADALRQPLQTALADDDEERAAAVIRKALSQRVAQLDDAQSGKRLARAESDAAQRRLLAAARHDLSLIEHGVLQLARSGDLVPTRLLSFLRDRLLAYGQTHANLADSGAIDAPEAVVERVADALTRHRVMARPLRVGVLRPSEVADLACGVRRIAELPTVRATGDTAADLRRWQSAPEIDAERRRRLSQGSVRDGELVMAIIEPTEAGQRVVVHPITGDGDMTAEPVESFAIESQDEPISALRFLVEPSVSRTRDPAQWLSETAAAGDIASPRRAIAELQQLAVTVNQARVDLYADILDQRRDLKGAARVQAERRLERMRAASEAAAHATDTGQLGAFLSQWEHEITRDMGVLLARSSGPHDSLEPLSRLGALRHRLDGIRATVEGIAGEPRAMRGTGGENLVFTRPQEEPASIFAGLTGTRLTPAARAAETQSVAGEALTADVVARDAARSTRPSTQAKQLVRAIREGGVQLRRALTSVGSLQESGLGLSSQLQPLLRASMPSDIRPNLRSPLMRQVLMPALERVSGGRGTRARRSAAAPSATAAPSLTPEALYGALLGQTGIELAERRPDMARSLLGQMSGLAKRFEIEGLAPNVATLLNAGQSIVNRLSGVTGTATPSPEVAEPASGTQVIAALGETMTTAGEAGPGGDAFIDDVSESLQSEASDLSTQLDAGVEQFLPGDVPYGQRVFQGAVSDMILSQMGAVGATVGRDIYISQGLGGVQKQAVMGHELAHVTQAAGQSTEGAEEEAYRVEKLIHDYLSDAELAGEQGGGGERKGGGGAGDDEHQKASDEEAEQEAWTEALADAVTELMQDDIEKALFTF